jgi:hypothetical protein
MQAAVRATLAVLLLFGVTATGAQVPAGTRSGRLAGEIGDTAGRRLPGAHITIELVQDPKTPSNLRFAPRSTTADSTGRFAFDSLPAGRYAIRSLMIGLRRWQDTVSVASGRPTKLSIRMSEDLVTRLYRENQALNAASWQPVLIFTESSDVPPCPTNLQASVTLAGDTIVVTGCEFFGHVGPTLVGGVHRYGFTIVLDVVPIESGETGAIVSERRYRAKILVPEPARYVLYVRLNIMSRTLDSELVTTRIVDLIRHTIEAPQ